MIGVFAAAFAEFRVADGPFLYARRFGENFTRSERGLPAAASEFSKHSALGGVGRAKFCHSTEQNNQFCSVERRILENRCSRKTVSRADGTGSNFQTLNCPHANNCSYFVGLTWASFSVFCQAKIPNGKMLHISRWRRVILLVAFRRRCRIAACGDRQAERA